MSSLILQTMDLMAWVLVTLYMLAYSSKSCSALGNALKESRFLG